MGGEPVLIDPPVVSSSEREIEVRLTAPEMPGRYVGYWRLEAPGGQKIGHRLWVDITVRDSLAESLVSSTTGGALLTIPNSTEVALPTEPTEAIGDWTAVEGVQEQETAELSASAVAAIAAADEADEAAALAVASEIQTQEQEAKGEEVSTASPIDEAADLSASIMAQIESAGAYDAVFGGAQHNSDEAEEPQARAAGIHTGGGGGGGDGEAPPSAAPAPAATLEDTPVASPAAAAFAAAVAPAPVGEADAPVSVPVDEADPLAPQLRQLADMGFMDAARNADLLRANASAPNPLHATLAALLG